MDSSNGEPAAAFNKTAANTRSGATAANWMIIRPPMEWPMKTALRTPSASSARSVRSTRWLKSAALRGRFGVKPWPAASKATTRKSHSRQPAQQSHVGPATQGNAMQEDQRDTLATHRYAHLVPVVQRHDVVR